MKKIKIALQYDAAATLCEILHTIRQLPAKTAPGLEVELLLCHEFYERYMSALHYPLPDEKSQAKNKFTLPESQAIALLKTLYGYDMGGYDAFSCVLRDDIVHLIAKQVGHLLSTGSQFPLYDEFSMSQQ